MPGPSINIFVKNKSRERPRMPGTGMLGDGACVEQMVKDSHQASALLAPVSLKREPVFPPFQDCERGPAE